MNTTFTGLNYLYSWEKQLPISDGVAYESLLRKYTLDYSVQSLARVDAFLDELRQAKTLHEETYLQESPNQTLFYLLAFYVGEVIGRSLRNEPQWFTHKEANEKFFPDDVSENFFETSLTLHFPNSTVGVSLFNPLISIVSRAFDEFTTKSVLFSAGALIPAELQKGPASQAPLKPLPARAWPFDVAAWMKNASALDRSKFAIATPDWAESDDLKFLFSNTEKLIGTGRLVWGALIQANGELFDPRGLLAGRAAPGEVLYDPAGRTSPEALCELAKTVFSLKATAVQDEACAYISQYLADETVRVFGLTLPKKIAAYPLKLSTTWFEQPKLAAGAIFLRHFPLIISDAVPGAVLPLPCHMWPDSFTQEWLDAYKNSAWANDKNAYLPPAEIASKHPMSLVEEGHVYFQSHDIVNNFEKAKLAWQRAAEQGNAAGYRGLAKLYEGGFGVKQDLKQAILHYEIAAKNGCQLSAESANAVRIQMNGRVVTAKQTPTGESTENIFRSGMQHYEGNGVAKDVRKAISFLKRAALRGHVNSMHNLGVIYGNGDDVKRDGRLAFGYYQKAADLGSPEAQEYVYNRKRTLIGFFEWVFRKT